MTTLWEVAESQQNLNAWLQETANIQQAPQQVEVQPTQPVEQINLTWTSSWVEQTQEVQPVQQQVPIEQPATPSTPSPEDLLRQIQWVIEENKTLEEVAREDDASRIQQENEAALKSLVEETTKDLPQTTVEMWEVKAQISDTAESDKMAQDIKESIEDMKTVNQAKDIAKKCYNALLKEKSLHDMDNKSNKDLIEYLQWIVNEQKRENLSKETDPRVVKLDDEGYTQWKLEEAYKKDKSSANRNNLNRLYLSKIAVNNPGLRINDLIAFMNNPVTKSNSIWDAAPTAAPVAEVKPVSQIPRGIPSRMRGML